jgi:beta-N-acetylhexosaminidase
LRDGGIIPCGKHFPGHGDTGKDSHLELPSVRKTLVELQKTELAPFAHACGNAIESLMTAHVIYPALDPNLPATLSEPIITGLLRHQLGFDGVVFSDDLAMKAISDHFEVEDAAGLAVRAGVDVLLFCHGSKNAMAACEFLCDEGERDPAVRAQVENSYRRITELKRRYLKSFTGMAANELTARLVELNHRRLINDNFGAD